MSSFDWGPRAFIVRLIVGMGAVPALLTAFVVVSVRSEHVTGWELALFIAPLAIAWTGAWFTARHWWRLYTSQQARIDSVADPIGPLFAEWVDRERDGWRER